jgi:hypothetical protein
MDSTVYDYHKNKGVVLRTAAVGDLLERKKMKKWYLKLCSRWLSVRVCISVTTYRKNIEQVLFEFLWLTLWHTNFLAN